MVTKVCCGPYLPAKGLKIFELNNAHKRKLSIPFLPRKVGKAFTFFLLILRLYLAQ